MPNPITVHNSDILTTVESVVYTGASGVVVDNDNLVISLEPSANSALSSVSELSSKFEDCCSSVSSDITGLSGYIDYVSGALTGYQPVGDYATTGDLNSTSGILSGAIDYISGVAVTSTAGLATTGDLDTASSFLSGAIDYVSANIGDEVYALSAGSSIKIDTDDVNKVNTISVSSTPFGVQEPLYFVENSETAVILGCSAQGDAEVNQVVHTYSANGTWLTNSDLNGYATTTDLETVSGDIVNLIPSTAGLATESNLQIVSGGVDYISGAVDYVSGNIPAPFAGYTSPSGTSLIDNTNSTIEQTNSAIGTVSEPTWRIRWSLDVSTVPSIGVGITPNTVQLRFTSPNNITGEIRLSNTFEFDTYESGTFNNSDEVIITIPEAWLNNTVYFYYNGEIPSNNTISGYTLDGTPVSVSAVRQLAWEDDLQIVSGAIPETTSFVQKTDMSAYIPFSATELGIGTDNGVTGNWSFAVGSANTANTGIALGLKNEVTGYGVGIGQTNTARGSVAIGRINNAVVRSVALGINASANTDSFAVIQQASAYDNSIAMGFSAKAEKDGIALGQKASAYYNSLALGENSTASNHSIAINGHAVGSHSIAIDSYAMDPMCISLGFMSRSENSGIALGQNLKAGSGTMVFGSYNYAANSANGGWIFANGKWGTTADIWDEAWITPYGGISARWSMSGLDYVFATGGNTGIDSTNSANLRSFYNWVNTNSGSWTGGGGGTTYTGDAQGALDEVYAHSGAWNSLSGLGISAVELVNSLPASATTGVLYLIPEV